MSTRRLLGGAVALLLFLGGGCRSSTATGDLGPLPDGGVPDAPAFEPCGSFCLRPSDCAFAYTSDGICPFGFLCSRDFQCAPDGGGD